MAHSVDEFGEQYVKLVVEAVCCQEQPVRIPSERIAESSYICVVTKFIQVIVNERNVESKVSLITGKSVHCEHRVKWGIGRFRSSISDGKIEEWYVRSEK